MSTLYRAQVLLEPEQHQALAEIARSGGQSISEVVREIVRQYLAEREQETQRQQELRALEALTQIRRQLQAQHGLYPGDLLAEIRADNYRPG